MDERRRLKERLTRTSSLDRATIDRAVEDGRLGVLTLEHELGAGGSHTLTDVARAARLPGPYVREFLQALGRPNPGHGDAEFSDEDIELGRIARRLIDAGLPRDDLVEAARVLSQAMQQSAEAIRLVVGDALLQPGDSEEAVAARYVEAIERLAPITPRLFDLTFRAHLRDGMRREFITSAEREAGRLANTRDVAVAFADLVGYTRLGDSVPAEELGSVAGRLLEIGMQVARRPVRLVKTVGDEAMFVSEDAGAMVATLTELCRRVSEAEPGFPDIRVGVAYGPATARSGDWFGATVNLASRVADAAKPGQLLATEAVVDRIDRNGWRKRRRRGFKGVDGRVRLFSYEGAPD
jgi:adenylate cyclase